MKALEQNLSGWNPEVLEDHGLNLLPFRQHDQEGFSGPEPPQAMLPEWVRALLIYLPLKHNDIPKNVSCAGP